MTETGRGAAAVAKGHRVIKISSSTACRELHLTPRIQAGIVTCSVLVIGWTIAASAGFLLSIADGRGPGTGADAIAEAYESRIAALTEERDAWASSALSAQVRYGTAIDRMSEQQGRLLTEIETSQEYELGLSLMRDKLSTAVGERDQAEGRVAELRAALTSLEDDAVQAPEHARELGLVLATMTGALRSAVRSRDTHKRDVSKLEGEIAALELRMEINADRQERMVASLEDAVTASFGPLETMFKNSGMDVDSLVSTVRRNYSGVGGPLVKASLGAPAFPDEELNARFNDMMDGMDRMNMLRVAAAKLPYTMPVRQAHRFTSGFGYRRDPWTGARRAHNGIDLAASLGTPIVATADGVVTFVGRQSGYGKLIRIRHEFGFETLYAHLNKYRVKVGDRIARGDHIGDMGNTGRSTGVHLHYEVRQGGKPVNPMTYIKAAQDVF